MHRLTARLLLFFALVGTLAPLALAATAAPPHACCRRKAHHCLDSAALESNQESIRDTSCCNHDCCRATISAQWAHSEPQAAAFFLQSIRARVPASQPDTPAAASTQFQSSRAPPTC